MTDKHTKAEQKAAKDRARFVGYRAECATLLGERGVRGVHCPCGADLSGRGGKTDWCLDCSTPSKRLTRCGVATRPKHTNQAPNGAFTPSVAPGSTISGKNVRF